MAARASPHWPISGRAVAAVTPVAEAAVRELAEAGAASGDRLWRMPLWREFASEMKGNHADLQNIASLEDDVVADHVIRPADMHGELMRNVVDDVVRDGAVVDAVHVQVDRGRCVTRIAVPVHVVDPIVVDRDISPVWPTGGTVCVDSCGVTVGAIQPDPRDIVVADGLTLHVERLEPIRIDVMDEVVPNHVAGAVPHIDSFSHVMHVVVFNHVVAVIAAHKPHAAAHGLGNEISVDRAFLDIAFDDHAVLPGVEQAAVLDNDVLRITQMNQSAFDIRMQGKTGENFQ